MSDAAKEYAAGLAAGVATVVIGHPFDTVKVSPLLLLLLLIAIISTSSPFARAQPFGGGGEFLGWGQVKLYLIRLLFSLCYNSIRISAYYVKLQKHNTEAHGVKYKNALHCTARILSSEGVRGLYRGATPSFVGMAFESSLLFGFYSQMKQSLQGEVHSSRPQLQVIIPSAACGGAIISFVLCPSELVKCRMQLQGTDTAITKYERYVGPLDCAVKTLKSGGIKGIFRGGFTTLLRESIGNAVFFSTYEFSRHYMHLRLDSTSRYLNPESKLLIDVGVGVVTGGLAGMAFWATVFPLDVAKTIIQTSPAATSTSNPFLTLNSIYRRVGLNGCYAGLGPTLVRAFPANAAAIVTWELTAKLLGVKRD